MGAFCSLVVNDAYAAESGCHVLLLQAASSATLDIESLPEKVEPDGEVGEASDGEYGGLFIPSGGGPYPV